MSTDLNPPTPAVEDRATYRTIPPALTGTEQAAAVTKVRYLERQLFDDGGHIRMGLTPARAEEIVALVNVLRHALGWLEIGLDAQWRWPADADAPVAPCQRAA